MDSDDESSIAQIAQPIQLHCQHRLISQRLSRLNFLGAKSALLPMSSGQNQTV
jgi:hypothetical protein